MTSRKLGGRGKGGVVTKVLYRFHESHLCQLQTPSNISCMIEKSGKTYFDLYFHWSRVLNLEIYKQRQNIGQIKMP